MTQAQVCVTDYQLAHQQGQDIHLGKAFAFRTGASPFVLSLLGPDVVDLPGAVVSPVPLPPLLLAGVTSDKGLYRAGRDTVHLLVFHLGQPGHEGTVQILSNGSEYTQMPVRLDEQGVATLTLLDLPAGDYEVYWQVDPCEEPCYAFTVAEYRLAPLVAELLERKLQAGRLTLKLRLQTFGVNVEGGVRLELTDQGQRIAEAHGLAAGGLLQAELPLTGDGPHAISLQLEADPSRTATVPLLGSRTAEREPTLFSGLGAEVVGSLLPGASARSVRGIYLESGAVRNTPFNLERVDATRARLTANEPAGPVCVVAVDLLDAGKRVRTDHEKVAAGDVIEIDVSVPLGLVAVGAIVNGAAWEGWAALLQPERIAPQIILPERCTPGSDVAVTVVTCVSASEVYLIVKDARLPSPDSPSNQLAGRMKACASAAGQALAIGTPDQTLADRAIQAPGGYFLEKTFGGVRLGVDEDEFGEDDFDVDRDDEDADIFEETTFDVPGLEDSGINLGEDDSEESDFEISLDDDSGTAEENAPQEEPEVLFAGVVKVANGRATVSVHLGESFADYVVEALVISGLDWAQTWTRFRAEKDVFAALDLPAFVHAEDTAEGRLHLGATSGRMLVRVLRDGVAVPLRYLGKEFPPRTDPAKTEISAHRAEVTFLVGPGRYEAIVEDAESGVIDRVERRVEEPGRLRSRVRTLHFLEPGQGLSRQDDPSIVALAVLPGLDRPFTALVEATADYGHACCEQTAAKLLAACAMYALTKDDDRRALAEAAILAGVRREGLMWLRGRGFKMYPEMPDDPHPYYGPKAARYLWELDLMRQASDALGPALRDAINQGLAMARDATAAYRLAWPPSKAESAEDVYSILRFNPDTKAHKEALNWLAGSAKRLIQALEKSTHPGGAVAFRAEAAYTAAALLRAGGGERGGALALANYVVGQLSEEGRLYSTLDSVAAIALLAELRAAGLASGSGRVEVDGRALTTSDLVLNDPIRSVRALEGVIVVEVTRERVEDWEKFDSTAPLRVALEKQGRAGPFAPGDALELFVKLEGGYQSGDLLHVCLPDALSRLIGGGQVKRFAVDFAGQDEVRVPLAATAATPGGAQKFAVCVRNMFEEERAGNPGLMLVSVR